MRLVGLTLTKSTKIILNKHLDRLASNIELPDFEIEMNRIMGMLNDPNFSFQQLKDESKRFEDLTEEEKSNIEEERQVYQNKLKESEKHFTYTNLFNKWALKMIDDTSP